MNGLIVVDVYNLVPETDKLMELEDEPTRDKQRLIISASILKRSEQIIS